MKQALSDQARVRILPQRARTVSLKNTLQKFATVRRRSRRLDFREQVALYPRELGRLGRSKAFCVPQIDE